jgi:hypothetical protein
MKISPINLIKKSKGITPLAPLFFGSSELAVLETP